MMENFQDVSGSLSILKRIAMIRLVHVIIRCLQIPTTSQMEGNSAKYCFSNHLSCFSRFVVLETWFAVVIESS